MFKRFFYFLAAFNLNMHTIVGVQSTSVLFDPPHSFEKEKALGKANELVDAGLFSQAIPFYLNILNTDSHQPVVRLYLAETYIQLEQFSDALAVIKHNLENPPSDPILCQSMYLAAICYKGLKQYNDAKGMFDNCLSTSNLLENEARFESGLLSFLSGNYEEAKKKWQLLSLNSSNPRLAALKHIYLARIALAQNTHSEAARIAFEELPLIEKNLDIHDVLHYEIAFVKGETSLLQEDFELASKYFQKSLPSHPDKCSWQAEALYHLGWCSLKMGKNKTASQEQQGYQLKKAEEYFDSVLKIQPEDKVYLALGQCYLAQGCQLNDAAGYAQAEALLSNKTLFSSKEAKAQALLLRAEAAPTYALREHLYRQLTDESNKESSFYGEGWYLRAWNAFEEGQNLFKQGEEEKALHILEKAAAAFSKAYELLQTKDPLYAVSAAKYQAIAIGYNHSEEASKSALKLLTALVENQQQELLDNPGEVYYLLGFYAARLAEEDSPEIDFYQQLTEQSLQHAANFTGKNSFQDEALYHLGSFYYHKKQYPEAEKTYLSLSESFPESPMIAEALFWAAQCADELNQHEVAKERRKKIYETFPESPFAAEAFFTMYSPQEYLQGDRQAIKHLQAFQESYNDTPLLLKALYWLGLDNKRDRKTEEGKWLRKKNLTEAINAFYQVEQQFDLFAQKKMISSESLPYYLTMRYRAMLERAQANLAIAEESQGAKRRIYLEYARDLFKELYDLFENREDPYILLLHQQESYPLLLEETSLYLSQTLIKEDNDQAAEKILKGMIERYQEAKTTRGYYFSRGWYELGQIAMKRQDYSTALVNFKQSQEAAKGNVLSTDQRLDLFLQESMCYRGLQQWDHAILVLSKVVNDDAISSLRLKAMYLRAEIYELQGRSELARKQLDSMVNKGGPWAFKAKEKLEKDYGY